VHDLPAPLRLTSSLPFVGRATELAALRALLPWDENDGRRIVLVGGEPGSGKTRLAREFAVGAAADGAAVLHGACDPEVRSPYGPFVEALDQLVRVIDAAELRAALGTAGGELTRILPDLPARVGDLAPPVTADPDTERHRLHTAVTDLLAGVSSRRPVLLVLEDGHWADAPTLLLLRHLARAAGHARLLVLATFRDTEVELPELSAALADLRRSEGVVRLRLAGLTGDEVTEFVRRASGADTGAALPELARTISDLTEGHPFLVCELWRTLVETEAVELVDGAVRVTRPLTDLGTPESVREVVSQRLSRLAPETTDFLELMATAGAEFELAVVRRAVTLGDAELVRVLEEAVGSGMIEELPGGSLSYRFTHELVRRALYARLGAVQRADLHLRVGEALERGDDRTGRVLADLAYHFAAAAPLDGAGRAVEYNVRAADAAMSALAYDEAAARLRTALDLRPEPVPERAELFLALGTASHRAGKVLDALDAFQEAAALARELGSAELLAGAAIGYEEACWRPGMADAGAVELLEEAVATLPEEGSTLRAGLLSGLARALDFQGDHGRASDARAVAIAMARTFEDPTALATVLMRAYWSRSSSLEDVLDMLTEARDLGEQLGNTEIRAEAIAWRVPAFVALCDLDAARREVSLLRETAEQTAQPFMLHVAEHYGSAIALGDGRLRDADAMAERSHEWSRLLTGRDASGVHGIQMFSLRREQGRLSELVPLVELLAGTASREGPWRPGLVSLLVELGMEAEARRELARITGHGLDPFRESLWLASLTYLTDGCAALRDEAVATLVYPELEPLGGANVMIGHLVAHYGAADRYLGMLAATMGEHERAEEHFERALELNRRMGAGTWLAHTLYEYARLLLAQPGGGKRRAELLLGEAATLTQRIGMPALQGRIRALGTTPRPSGLPDGLSPREVQVLQLVAQGLSNRDIGAALVISEHTAANHIRSILRKTGCANRTEAASYAHRQRLVEA
jgi:DNA-binding CsgD family transcriptional regulator